MVLKDHELCHFTNHTYWHPNLGWRFWIAFIVFNAAFMPVIYIFYPQTANRTPEDIDEYYRNNPSLMVTKDKDAIGSKRPQGYTNKDEIVVEQSRRESIASMQEKYQVGDGKRPSTHVEMSKA